MSAEHALRLLVLACTLACSACATVTGSRTQTLALRTSDRQGVEVREADCELANDEGKWTLVSPGSVDVHRSNKDLMVYCRKAGVEDGMATVVSSMKGTIWGNILVGGGVGALVDHSNGSAYVYPDDIRVVMGERHQIDLHAPAPDRSAAADR